MPEKRNNNDIINKIHEIRVKVVNRGKNGPEKK